MVEENFSHHVIVTWYVFNRSSRLAGAYLQRRRCGRENDDEAVRGEQLVVARLGRARHLLGAQQSELGLAAGQCVIWVIWVGVVFELVQEGVESDSSIEEAKIVEHNRTVSVCVDEGVSQKSLIEYLIMDEHKLKKIEEGDHGDELSVSVCKKSKSKGRKKCAKMGAKLIKKIVPKKLCRRRRNISPGQSRSQAGLCNQIVYFINFRLIYVHPLSITILTG
ncbi:hypothetical protein M0R45_026039 [Rubus argutus]|uniref:Uncharacterized protein n=1 Tax=Rubus argutus TaxID=59490 RepID=A0AAW1WXT0_RUBAR